MYLAFGFSNGFDFIFRQKWLTTIQSADNARAFEEVITSKNTELERKIRGA